MAETIRKGQEEGCGVVSYNLRPSRNGKERGEEYQFRKHQCSHLVGNACFSFTWPFLENPGSSDNEIEIGGMMFSHEPYYGIIIINFVKNLEIPTECLFHGPSYGVKKPISISGHASSLIQENFWTGLLKDWMQALKELEHVLFGVYPINCNGGSHAHNKSRSVRQRCKGIHVLQTPLNQFEAAVLDIDFAWISDQRLDRIAFVQGKFEEFGTGPTCRSD